jgi:hypothetical protein
MAALAGVVPGFEMGLQVDFRQRCSGWSSALKSLAKVMVKEQQPAACLLFVGAKHFSIGGAPLWPHGFYFRLLTRWNHR